MTLDFEIVAMTGEEHSTDKDLLTGTIDSTVSEQTQRGGGGLLLTADIASLIRRGQSKSGGIAFDRRKPLFLNPTAQGLNEHFGLPAGDEAATLTKHAILVCQVGGEAEVAQGLTGVAVQNADAIAFLAEGEEEWVKAGDVNHLAKEALAIAGDFKGIDAGALGCPNGGFH